MVSWQIVVLGGGGFEEKEIKLVFARKNIDSPALSLTNEVDYRRTDSERRKKEHTILKKTERG